MAQPYRHTTVTSKKSCTAIFECAILSEAHVIRVQKICSEVGQHASVTSSSRFTFVQAARAVNRTPKQHEIGMCLTLKKAGTPMPSLSCLLLVAQRDSAADN